MNVHIFVPFCRQSQVIECRVGCFKKNTQHSAQMCVCVWGTNDLRNSCGSAVTHTHTPFPADNFSLNAATATAGALDLWCGWFFSSEISLLFIFFISFFSIIFYSLFSSSGFLWADQQLGCSTWLTETMKYERHKGWIKFLNLNVSLKEKQWSTSSCRRKIQLHFENMTTMLDTSSWLHTGPAPFGSAPVSRVMRKKAVRLDRERRACLSLREGVESCCMYAFRLTNTLKAFSKCLNKALTQPQIPHKYWYYSLFRILLRKLYL